jgi:hypothetical protein
MSAPVTPPPFEPSFAAALLDPGLPVPLGVVSDNAPSLSRRFAVHRNNVVAGLVEALEARFPAVEKIVGKEFFVAMALAFIQKRPPRSPLLAAYGDEFAEFIGAFEPAHELPYLVDVARIEAARTRAYHAADAAPLGASELAQLDAKTLSGLRVDLHPSLEIVRSAHPVVTIWAMNSGAQKLEPIGPGPRRMGLSSGRISTWRSASCRRAVPRSCARWLTADRSARLPTPRLPMTPPSI